MSVIKVKIQEDFTVLYNGVLEDKGLSFKAKGLWAYCMSRPKDWQFHVTHLATISKEKEKAIYAALHELMKAGLVQRTQKNKPAGQRNGREGFEQVEYTVFPYPQEIQNIFAHRRFAQAQDARPQKEALLSTDNNQELKETNLSCPRSETDTRTTHSPPPSKPKIEERAYEVAKKLLGKVLEMHPKFKAPKIDNWAKDIDLAIRRDNRTYEELEAVIEFAFQDEFWRTTLQSAEGLRRNFDKISLKMRQKESPVEKNKILVMRAKRNLASQGIDAKDMYLSVKEGCVIRLDKGIRISLELEPQEFKHKFMEAFELYV